MCLPLLLACATRTSGAVHPDAVVAAIETVQPVPGGFTTLTCRVENRSEVARETRTFLVQLQAPRGWGALSTERTISLESGEERTVPFTVRVPAQASSDSLHTAVFTVRAPSDSLILGLAACGLHVRTRFGVSLTGPAEAPAARAGQEVSFVVVVRNTGNQSDTVRLSTSSTPTWPVVLASTEIAVPAGATRAVTVTLRVPAEARAATLHLLGVSAASEGAERAGLGEQARARLEVRTTAMERREETSRYARLPVEASVSAGEAAPGQHRLGLRVQASGQVGAGTAAQLEADLASGPRADGRDGWDNQLLLARVTRSQWEAGVGDVSGEFSDLATATVSGRGFGLTAHREAWSARVLGVRNRGVGRARSWGVGLTRILPGGPQVGGDLIYRQERVGTSGLRSHRLVCLNSVWDAPREFRLGGELAFSGSKLEGDARAGRAVQLTADRSSRPLQLRARLYTGSSDFGGRTRDRDGLLLFGAYTPSLRPLRFWSHLESTRGRSWATTTSPLAKATRYRTGARWEPSRWPSVELSLGGLDDRSALGDSVHSSTRRDAGLSSSWARGRFLAAASVRRGAARDRSTGVSGSTGGTELSVGGRVQDWRLALRWNLERDWAPETHATLVTRALAADLAWIAPARRLSAGLGLTSRRLDAGPISGPDQVEIRMQPRADYRLGAKLRLQLDASIADLDGSTRVDRWQISLRYASDDLLPVPWSPVRGGIRGVAFLDTDADGEPDAGERRVDGLLLRVDGRQQVTGSDGVFEWPSLEPGTYWVDLDRASVPQGLVVSVTLPLEVRVTAGSELPVYVPLLPCGEASGVVFLDRDHDGRQADGEHGVSDLRVAAWRDDRQIADGVTDAEGRFHLRVLPVGAYELRIDPAWLPAGWSTTGENAAEFAITSGRAALLAPLGIGPRRKPIIITYPGSRPSESQDTAPPLAPTDTPPEPGRRPGR